MNTVIFDKTGTLTLGEFRVVETTVADGPSEDEFLRIAAGVESESEHPIARGIVKTAEDRTLDVPAAARGQAAIQLLRDGKAMAVFAVALAG